MKHIIKKQVIEIGIDMNLDAFATQHDISTFYRDRIIPHLEKIFDELCGENEVIMADRLEIELGTLSPDDLKHQWAIGELLASITRQLYQQIQVHGGAEQLVQRKEISWSIFQQWMFYMEKGFLPWNATMEGEEWYAQVLESVAIEYQSAEKLKILLRTRTSAVERIVMQHPTSFLMHLTELLTARSQAQLPAYMEAIIRLFSFAKNQATQIKILHRALMIRLWKKVLLWAASGTPMTAEMMAEALLLYLFSEAELVVLMKNKTLSRKFPSIYPFMKEIVQGTHASLRKAADDQPVNEKLQLPDENDVVDLKSPEEAEPSEGKESKPGKKTETEKLSGETDTKDDEDNAGDADKELEQEGIFARNAGLVILGPFIEPMFRHLNWIHEGKFISALHHQKSLYLLHYLATGRTEAEEHELVMAKVLSGYEISGVVEKETDLEEDELNEADGMLQEVIAQWEILKTTSPDGLREGFLQRTGKLCMKNDHLSLTMETNAIDVLLDYLPWNLSIIRLPWMKRRLMVEWR